MIYPGRYLSLPVCLSVCAFRPRRLSIGGADARPPYKLKGETRRLMKDGGKGIVVEVPGAVVACNYCPAFTVCRQKDEYLADGTLTPL